MGRREPPQNTRTRPSRASVPERPQRTVNERVSRAQPSVRVSRAPEPVVPERWPIVTGSYDPVLVAVVWALVCFGVVMVYSASAGIAYQGPLRNGEHYLIRQAAYGLVGLSLMHIVARVDYHRLKSITYLMLLGVIGLMCAVAFGLGHSAGGATRWLRAGPVNVQPVEIAKVVWVCTLAYSLSRKAAQARSAAVGLVPALLGTAIVAGLCLAQPDLGSAIIIGTITLCVLFVAGARMSSLLGLGVLALPVIYFLVIGREYRVKRFLAYLSPYEHRQGAAFQLWESLLSYGAGGVRGVGLGFSTQKMFFLPEPHTDFISAIVAEELGFLGYLALFSAFGVLVWRGLRAAFASVDEHGAFLAAGLTILAGMQALINLAIAVGLLPTKGLVLPFISYGGSSLLMNCVAMGVVLNVSKPRVRVSDVAAGGARAGISPASTSGSSRNKLPKVAGGVT